MSEPNLLANPYVQFGDEKNGRFFVGRRPVLEWIENNIFQDPDLIRLLLISGEAQIGKTALLHHIERENNLIPEQLTIYLDFKKLEATSISHLLYSVVNVIIAHPEIKTKLAQLEPTQAEFVANPFETFAHYLLQIQYALPGRNILLLGDNVEQIWLRLGDVRQSSTFLEKFNNALLQTTAVWCIVTTKTQPEILISQDSALTQIALAPLSFEETWHFIRQPAAFTVVQEVAEFIHQLTGGYPTRLHALCHAIFNLQEEKNIKLITIADITYMLNEGDVEGIAWHKGEMVHGLELTAVQRPIPWSKLQMRTAGIVGGILLLVLLGTFTNVFAQFRQNEPATPIAQQTPAIDNSSNQQTIIITQTVEIPIQQTEAPDEPPTSIPSSTPAPTETPTQTPTVVPTPTNTPDAYPRLKTRTADNMPMRLIPEGTFLMGSIEDEFLSSFDEWPQREVTISQFYMDQYEVSVAQYTQFLNRLGGYLGTCDFHDCALPRLVVGYTSYLDQQELVEEEVQFTPFLGFSNYPINHVSWYGANSYCEAMGARLPTEAEWEYAARGTDGRLYPWGDEAPTEELAVFNSSNFENMKPVDALPDGVSPFGLYNMAGSVWEWTADWYDEEYYREAPDIDPPGPETGLSRVIRGGAWPFNNQADRLRTANRNQLTPDFISSTVGFRCAQDP